METQSIDRVLNKDNFYRQSKAGNKYRKLVPNHFLTLVNSPKEPIHKRNSLENKYFKGLSKSLEKVNFIFFQTQFFFMDKIMKTKETWN